MEEDCVPGVPTPGVDNCHSKEEQIGNPVTEEVHPAFANMKPNCNPAKPCIAGVPVAGIGCCTEEERAIHVRLDAHVEHRPVEVLAVPVALHHEQQQEAVVVPHPGVEVEREQQPAAGEEVPKPKVLAVPLDCNPDPACQPLKEITPGVMDCCAKTVSLDRLLAQDTVVAAEGIVEQQQQQPEAAVVTPEAAAIFSPEVKELQEELQEAKEEQVQEIEKELEEAKEELKEQEESDGNSNSGDIISDVGEDTPSLATAPVIEGEQEAPKVVELPSEADAKFEARVFEWGPGHEVVPNDA